MKLPGSTGRLARAALPVAALLVLAGCASSGAVLSAPRSQYGSATPEQAVRTFLDAASSKDYQRMGQQFGTRKGPAELTLGARDVEQRMVVLAAYLEHGGYTIEAGSQSLLESYEHRFLVHLTGTGRGAVTVPIVAATTKDGRWFVERIDLDPLTRPSGR
ncbi:MAG TPA: hypothetical protein VKB18_10685 [Gemmatimonadota bacterium]|nr:hypothetical protein [Gemmatimonadota bacterium]